MNTITLIALEKDCHKRGKRWVAVAQELYLLQQEKKRILLMEKKLSEDLIDLSGNVNSYGDCYVYSSTVRKGTVDYEAIPELKSVDLDLYRKKPSIAWSLKKC